MPRRASVLRSIETKRIAIDSNDCDASKERTQAKQWALVGRAIFVSAGHGAGDPGALGPGGPKYDFTEADLTLELRDLVIEELARRGERATRDGKAGESLSRDVSIERAASADVAVDLHFNAAADGGGGSGVECFGLEEDRALCKRFSKAVAAVLGLKLRGVGGYKHHTETRHGKRGLGFCLAGGVLLEVCFLSKHDLERYLPRKIEVAKAIGDVLVAAANGTVGGVDAADVKNLRRRPRWTWQRT